MTENDRVLRAMEMRCPYCGVEPWALCRSQGAAIAFPHRERFRAAARSVSLPEPDEGGATK